MKKLLLTLAGASLALLAGCVVTSVYPFYTEKDLTFEPGLVGSFAEHGGDDKANWTFEEDKDKAYKLTIHDSEKTLKVQAHLFKLGGHLFLDCFTGETAENATVEPLPTHLVIKIRQFTPGLKVCILDYDWLTKLLEQKPKALRHIVVPTGDNGKGGRVVLTAETAELQKFLLKYVDNKDAWGDDAKNEEMVRLPAQTSSK